jgi:AI-2 transport protein TqsA
MEEGTRPLTQEQKSRRTTNLLLALIAVVAVGAALKAAKPVVVPLFLASFLAIILRPILNVLSRFLPWWMSLMVTFTGLVGAMFGLWSFLASSFSAVAERGPQYVEQLRSMGSDLSEFAAQYGIAVSFDRFTTNEYMKFGLQALGASLMSLFSIGALVTIVAFMLTLLLLEAEHFERAINRGTLSQTAGRAWRTVDTIFNKFQRYFYTKAAISMATAGSTFLLTWALGVDFPVIWAGLAFILNFLPNIGSIIAVIPPTLIAIVQYASLSYGVVTFVGLTAIQLFIGNFLDPRIMGKTLQLSPFVLFCSMVFWGWLWGVVGIFLAVPLTVGVQIVFEQFPIMQPVARFMRGAVTHTPADDDEGKGVLAAVRAKSGVRPAKAGMGPSVVGTPGSQGGVDP